MIITFLGKSVKEYRKKYLELLNQIIPMCPICHGKCHNHGWYNRKVRDPERIIIKILRVICVSCRQTHAILPDFIFPKGRYPETMREETIQECEISNRTQEKASQIQAVETTRRWIKRYRKTIKTIIAALRSVLARQSEYQTGATGGWTEQLKTLCGKIETKIGRIVTSSSLFGKVNILLSWENTRIWI